MISNFLLWYALVLGAEALHWFISYLYAHDGALIYGSYFTPDVSLQLVLAGLALFIAFVTRKETHE